MYLYFSIPATHIKNRSYLLLTTCYACYVVIKQYVMLQCVGGNNNMLILPLMLCYIMLCCERCFCTRCSRFKPCLSVIKQGASPAGGQWRCCNGYWKNGQLDRMDYECNEWIFEKWICVQYVHEARQGNGAKKGRRVGLLSHFVSPLFSFSFFLIA